MIIPKKFGQISDSVILVIADDLKTTVSNFNERFFDFKEMDLSVSTTQPLLVDICDLAMQYQQSRQKYKMMGLLKPDSNKTQGTMTWLSEETKAKYPNSMK